VGGDDLQQLGNLFLHVFLHGLMLLLLLGGLELLVQLPVDVSHWLVRDAISEGR